MPRPPRRPARFPCLSASSPKLRLREAAEARARANLAQQQAEAERARFMATPLPIDEAVKVLRAERNVRNNQDLTPAFIRSIRAERDTISPGELAITATGWQPCLKCRARGLTGHDLDGTLAYCDLPSWFCCILSRDNGGYARLLPKNS